jgi:hypothetical protein
MKEIYVEVISEPITESIFCGLGSVTWYKAMWEGKDIIVNTSLYYSIPSVGSKGVLIGNFYPQRFYDNDGKSLDIPYFLVEG